MNPTGEQRDALDMFTSGMGLAIEAGAGTGKTTTLKMLGAATSQRCQYVAFNRAIVDEASRKMPRNVRASTAHSLAMRAVGRRFAHRLGGHRMRSMDVARQLDLDPIVVSFGDQRKVIQPSYRRTSMASTSPTALAGAPGRTTKPCALTSPTRC
jgi:hypothetical protein